MRSTLPEPSLASTACAAVAEMLMRHSAEVFTYLIRVRARARARVSNPNPNPNPNPNVRVEDEHPLREQVAWVEEQTVVARLEPEQHLRLVRVRVRVRVKVRARVRVRGSSPGLLLAVVGLAVLREEHDA